MRFNEIIYNQLEIDDDIIEEYIRSFDRSFDEEELSIDDCTIDDFIDFVTERYYIEDFIETTDCEYNLKKEYFHDELNRVKAQMKK
jgi:uncharacterized protein YacL (UPF0231 family)